MKIFLIAGIGADTRVYNNIDLGEEYDVIPVLIGYPATQNGYFKYYTHKSLSININITPKSP